MIVKICIGSACHLKGSREIIEQLQDLVDEHKLDKVVELNGAFCSENCVNGVCVTVDDDLFSVSPQTTKKFFEDEILRRL
ncbi:MAG: NAD(P)H-dependent oxidoreductase subunit E [Faecalibacterium sp.]